MSGSRFLYAEIEAFPEAVGEVGSLLAGYGERVRAEPGNAQFAAFALADAPGRFFVFEEYESEEAFTAHASADYCDRFNERLAPLVVGGGSTLTWLDPIA